MENIEVARHLEELADLLEIQGANPFRIRAYRNAIRLIRGLTRPLSDMVAADEDLTELPGIGADLCGHILELLESGRMSLLDEVVRDVPRELAVLTRIEGLGPKKVAKLWKELGIVSLDALQEAAEAGRVAELEGFGAKSQNRILRAIPEFRSHQGRFLRSEAAKYLRPVLVHLEACPGIVRMEVAGSYRRGVETVGDVDLLVSVAGESAREVMEHFIQAPGVERVEARGETKGRIVLHSGLPVDLRILPEAVWGAALHHFTGSKEHNVQMRGLARDSGLRISEYGVFRDPVPGTSSRDGEAEGSAGIGGAGKGHPGDLESGATEEEVFAAVGLPWIPPVLREGRGEIEAAREDRLPDLVRLEDIRGDLHMHTRWSDGAGEILEMATACRDRGYEYLAITDHSRAVTVARGLTPERLREQAEEIATVRGGLDGIHLLHGCEVDILKDGSLDLPDDVLEELDLVLVAVHSHFNLDRKTQTDRVIRALAHPMVDILVHPTGRLLNRREPYAIDVEAVLEAAASHDVAVELNASPRRLDLNDRHLFRARELGLTVSIATDAHSPERLDHMTDGILQAQRGWIEPGDVLNTRPFGELMSWLRRRGRS